MLSPISLASISPSVTLSLSLAHHSLTQPYYYSFQVQDRLSTLALHHRPLSCSRQRIPTIQHSCSSIFSSTCRQAQELLSIKTASSTTAACLHLSRHHRLQPVSEWADCSAPEFGPECRLQRPCTTAVTAKGPVPYSSLTAHHSTVLCLLPTCLQPVGLCWPRHPRPGVAGRQPSRNPKIN